MADNYKFDVFLSHSSKDKPIVRSIAERLRVDGVKVWFDEWEIRPGDSIPAKVDEGLEHSRVLVLCMSSNAFSSDWAVLESQTFRFRDPLNKDRRFIPLRLDDAPIKGSLGQFLYIDWRLPNSLESYKKLIASCLQATRQMSIQKNNKPIRKKLMNARSDAKLGLMFGIFSFSGDKSRVLCGHDDSILRLWSVKTKDCLRTFKGHSLPVWSVALNNDDSRALSGSYDKTVRLWNVETGDCIRVFEGFEGKVHSLIWSPNYNFALVSSDSTIHLLNIETGRHIYTFKGHTKDVGSLAWHSSGETFLSGCSDGTIRLWSIETGGCLHVFEGHTDQIRCVDWSPNGEFFLSSSNDSTIRLWNVETRECLRVLEGHTRHVWTVAWSPNGRFALSGGEDRTLRLWDIISGNSLQIFREQKARINSIVWSSDGYFGYSGAIDGTICIWNTQEFINDIEVSQTTDLTSSPQPKQVQYTNAKVLLVGDSGAGKTGLSKRLASDNWQPTDSTVGAWATQWKLSVSSNDDNNTEREIWLWDFGGQADQRLIHQLYMDDTALAVLVFDGQKDDLFETLGQWDRDLSRASSNNFDKLLVAGRVDAGGLRVSRAQLEAFKNQRGYLQLLETSAKADIGCQELKQSILDSIRWDKIPWRSSPLLFKQLKEEIILLKDSGRILMRFNELRETLHMRSSNKDLIFNDEVLLAVIRLLKGPGVVWELKFGNWILLQPELINSYAQAVIQTLRTDEGERGCLSEERVLDGALVYNASIARLIDKDEERIVLLAMHQALLERGLCLREHTERGTLLVFPSYYRRERPELIGHPAVLVSYRFNGFLDDIYSTLVVRLHHTHSFTQDQLWRYAADFKTLTGKQLGIKMIRLSEGDGELEVYFDPTIPMEEKIIFSKYVHEHLLQKAKDVVRLRHYVCPHCGTPVGNHQVAMRKLEEGKKDIPCISCDDSSKRVPLWDQLEELFASQEIRQIVNKLQRKSSIKLDNESKERALVGEVISTVALAGQISREFNVSDHGIDMEIEFKSDAGEATGRKIYLQLKSGNTYLHKRKRDGAEVFTIKDERHIRYWIAQPCPVLLVVRNSDGEVRWMEISSWLKQASNNGKSLVTQIVFTGERFDVMSVRRWRDESLS